MDQASTTALPPPPPGKALLEGVLLKPELLCSVLLFLDHGAALRMGATARPWHRLLLGGGDDVNHDCAYLWRALYRRRWVFGGGPRRGRGRGRGGGAAAPLTSTQAAQAAYRDRHLLARNQEEGKAGQYRLHTVRPPRNEYSSCGIEYMACLLESQPAGPPAPSAGDDGGASLGPVAFVGTSRSAVGRFELMPASQARAVPGGRPTDAYAGGGGGDYEEEQHDGSALTLGCVWQTAFPEDEVSAWAIAREGQLVACAAYGGRILLLDAKTGANLLPPERPMIQWGDRHACASELLFLEGNRWLAVASNHQGPRISIYCTQTGRLCQEIPPLPRNPQFPFPRDGGPPLGVQLLRCPNASSRGRAHFVVLETGRVRFFVQDREEDGTTSTTTSTSTSTTNNGSSNDGPVPGFRPFTEHGRLTHPSDGSIWFKAAAVAPAATEEEKEAGPYRVFLGDNLGGTSTTRFFVHPRIHLARLMSEGAGGGDDLLLRRPYQPIDTCNDAITVMQVVNAPSFFLPQQPPPGASSAAAAERKQKGWVLAYGNGGGGVSLLLLRAHQRRAGERSAFIEPWAKEAEEEEVKEVCEEDEDAGEGGGRRAGRVGFIASGAHREAVTALHLDVDRGMLLTGSRDESVKVWTLRQKEEWAPKPLYTLLGGARSTWEKRGVRALACGDAEVMAAFRDKLRVYDFSPAPTPAAAER